MTIVVTGAAGFIGYHLSVKLLSQGQEVIGIDSLNDYYDVNLKQARLMHLRTFPSFHFILHDLSLGNLAPLLKEKPIETIVHLAAYAGVRYSLLQPQLYLEKNILGQLAILDWARQQKKPPYIAYASSSSVYGNALPPFREDVKDLTPLSPYAVSKRSAELLSECYASLYGLNQSGLRFFTVYGPWGRPDMAYYKFASAIINDEKIKIFGDGTMRRDFTYISDIIEGICAVIQKKSTGHRLYNLGNDQPLSVNDLIKSLEKALGKEAICEYGPEQQGEVPITWADLSLSRRELGYRPLTSLEPGIEAFVTWYKDYATHVKMTS